MLKPRRNVSVFGLVFQWLFIVSLTPFLSVSATNWYCKDAACSDVVFDAKTTHPYNPSSDAVKNGYLSAEPHEEVKVYRLAKDPFIVDVELNGKRGFLPRSLILVTKDYIGDQEYNIIDGPVAPGESDPYVGKSVTEIQDDVKTTPVIAPVASSDKADSSQKTPDIVESEKEKAPADTKVEDKTDNVKQEVSQDVPVDIEASSDVAKGDKEIPVKEDSKKVPPVANDVAVPESKSEIVPSVEKDPVGDAVLSTEAEQKPPETEIRVKAKEIVKANTEPVKENPVDPVGTDKSVELDQKGKDSSPKEPVLEPVAEKPDEALKVVDQAQNTAVNKEDSKQVETVDALKNDEDPGKQEPPKEVPKSQEAEQPIVTTTPILPLSSLVKPPAPLEKPAEATTISPTAPDKQSPSPAPSSSVVIPQPAETVKLPEPKVTFQDSNRIQLDNYPRYGQPPPVFTTKVPNRHHHHHQHDHGHGAHDHGHGGHSHEHHDHAGHSHEHDHSHSHSHGEPHVHAEAGSSSPTTASNGHDHGHAHEHDHAHPPAGSSSPNAAIGDHGHDHSHDHNHAHDHSHDQQEKQLTTKEPSDIVPIAENLALAPNANLTFIPPEDATQSPVNYTQLVLDRMEGKTEPGLLNEALDKEPSRGYPVPPPLDPSTATEAPRIPGSSDDVPRNELETALNDIERYQRGRQGFLKDTAGKRDLRGGRPLELPHQDHVHSHGGDHHHHDHGHSHDNDHHHTHAHVHDHNDTATHSDLAKSEVLDEPVLKILEVPSGSCAARLPGDASPDSPCEDIVPLSDNEDTFIADEPLTTEKPTTGLKTYWHNSLLFCAKCWVTTVMRFEEKVSADLRLIGMVIMAVSAVVFMLIARADRKIRKTMEQGFEAYDHKKDQELLTLRGQIQQLLQERVPETTKPVMTGPGLPPPVMPPLPHEFHRGPCVECEQLKTNMNNLINTVRENDRLIKEQRDQHSSVLGKNNDIMTELRLISLDRDQLKRELETTSQKLVDMERRQMQTGHDNQRENEIVILRRRLEETEAENLLLKTSSGSSSKETTHQLLTLQSERDESSSNVRLLKQLLGEKEEEIRKMRAADASGGSASARELKERAEDVIKYKKQSSRLREDLENMRRDMESQLQVRCQSFRIAADKAQRDALMARQETIVVRQQLEELCRKYGEQIPAVVIPQLANGAATPPGMMGGPPMMFPTMAYPPGPPPPTFEQFKQQVLSQGSSSGHNSPRSPHSEREWRREKENGRKKAQDKSKNGRSGMFDESSDVEKDDKKDRSKR